MSINKCTVKESNKWCTDKFVSNYIIWRGDKSPKGKKTHKKIQDCISKKKKKDKTQLYAIDMRVSK